MKWLWCALLWGCLAAPALAQVPGGGVSGPTVSVNGDCVSFKGTNGQVIQDAGAPCGSGSSGLTFTDTTHTVTGVTTLTVAGGVIGGTTPNGTLTISASAASFTPGTTTILGATAPCVLVNSTGSVSACVPYGLTGNSTVIETTSGGLLTASILPLATNAAEGAVKGDGVTICIAAGIGSICVTDTVHTVSATTANIGGQDDYSGSSLTATLATLASGQSLMVTDQNATALTLALGGQTVVGLPLATTLHTGGFYGFNFNSASTLSGFGFPGFGTITTGALMKFIDGSGAATAGDLSGDCTTSGSLVVTCAKGSSSVFGIVKVDNVTITASGGVISAVGGAATTITPGTTTIAGATAPCTIRNTTSTTMGCTAETGTSSVVLSASPALTGTPTAPTATVGTNTTQLATTAFVLANGGSGLTIGTTAITSGTANALMTQGSSGNLLTTSKIVDNQSLTTIGEAAVTTPGALTDGATIATNAFLSDAFSVTIAGNRTLSNPTNLTAGQSIIWTITQDGTGGRTLAFGTAFNWLSGSAPLLNSTAAAKTLIACYADSTSTLQCSGGKPVVAATTQAQVSAPTAPASTTTYFMQGLAGTITPTASGTVLITISGTVVDPSGTAAGNGLIYQISYGTGSAPANAAALAGTQAGSTQSYTSPTTVIAADTNVPFSTQAVVTGLTVGTAYWIDLAAKSLATASSMGVANISVSAVEIR